MRYFCTMALFFASTLCFGQKNNWIPFNWEGSDIGGRHFDKLAMTVPLTIDKLPYKFKMQLDLGAVESLIYGQSFLPYLEQNPELKRKIDTTLTFRIQDKTYPIFKEIGLKIGDVAFGKRNIGYFKDFGDSLPKDSLTSKNEQLVGTIAPDMFQGKILIIDFPRQAILVSEKLPKEYAQAAFQAFKINDGRIKIPFNIDGKTQDLLFDTGSSLFSLVSTKANVQTIAHAAVSDSLQVSSWGTMLTFYGHQTKVPIKFGEKQLAPTNAYFDSVNSSEQLFKNENIWGIAGNAFFLQNTVIIDYKNRRFGIK